MEPLDNITPGAAYTDTLTIGGSGSVDDGNMTLPLGVIVPGTLI
ncbi:MAG: hypothetical protein CM1200mP10_03640 [Candidatus Neomarinimicrobiota bacterium]|nr:MAG: hypothetical protein CM1200mP10_03640 [Candidatus Neomarinimicrobiota bacterium]